MGTSHWAVLTFMIFAKSLFQDQQRRGFSDIMLLEDRLPLTTIAFLFSMKETAGVKQEALFLDEIIPESLCVGNRLYFSD
jgi:hypothetical protein